MKALLCVDGDTLFEKVLGTVRWCLQLEGDGSVGVIHVAPVFDWMRHETVWADWIRAEEEKNRRLHRRAREYLSSLGIPCETWSARGGVAAEILRVADETRTELIVIGALGRPGSGFLIGSVSQRVKDIASTDVLVVRGDAPNEEEPWRAIIAVDGSDESLAAVESFARKTRARTADVRLVHVLDVPLIWSPAGNEFGSFPDMSSILASLRERGTEALTAAQALLRTHGIETRTEIRTGTPETEILDAATAHRAHLIAMGSRGLSRIEGALLGSVTQRVVRHATTSVLVARSGSL